MSSTCVKILGYFLSIRSSSCRECHKKKNPCSLQQSVPVTKGLSAQACTSSNPSSSSVIPQATKRPCPSIESSLKMFKPDKSSLTQSVKVPLPERPNLQPTSCPSSCTDPDTAPLLNVLDIPLLLWKHLPGWSPAAFFVCKNYTQVKSENG